MLSERELKRRLGEILSIEERGGEADWFAIASLSVNLLEELHGSAPQFVRAYLTDFDIRRANHGIADEQRAALVRYIRSATTSC